MDNTEIGPLVDLNYASPSQQMGIEVGLLFFQCMERTHGIQPIGNCATRNPGIYNPLNVDIKLVVEDQYKGTRGQHTFLGTFPGTVLLLQYFRKLPGIQLLGLSKLLNLLECKN